ncbi:hypothetical protein Tco_1448844 [Tanacetum coccineum]
MTYLKNRGQRSCPAEEFKFLKSKKEFDKAGEAVCQEDGKRRKQIARKGLHSRQMRMNLKLSKDDESYFRENGTDIVYINFGAMLKDITRDDLTELYRIVMNRYGMNGPEDELEKVCKAMLDKKLQGGKPDEDCYKLLKMMEKQAGIRKHKDWLVQEQTALGKDFSNPLMADNLPKISEWLTGKETSNPFKIFNDSPLTGVNTPGSDENRLKLYDLMYIIVNVADMMDC